MSDMIDMYRDMKTMRAAERQRLGQPCPVCQVKLPRAQPKVLLPGRWCRAHKPHYQDPRAELSIDAWNAAMAGTGCVRIDPTPQPERVK